MHQGLLICEIFRMICEHLLESLALRSLAALAVACKAFENTALDVLWLEQTSLVPILGSLPSDIWVLAPRHNIWNRALLSSDLTRFLYYSHRVKIYREGCSGVAPSFFCFRFDLLLALQTIAPVCFPNIHTLEWGDFGLPFEWLPFFLGPHITSITLTLFHCGSATPVSLSFLPRLKYQYPFLKHVSFTFDLSHTRSVSDAVSAWGYLHTLTLNGLDGNAWLHLPTFTRLKVLKVGTFGDDLAQFLQAKATMYPHGFTALCELRIGTSTVSACSQLMIYFSESPLEILVIGLRSSSGASCWKYLNVGMQRGCLHSTLKTMHIHRADSYQIYIDSEPGPQPRNTDVLVPLLSFPNLMHLVLQPSFAFSLDSDILGRLDVWSRLETLDLGPELKCDEQPGVLGLIPFAVHCRSLRSLRIFVDANINIPNIPVILRMRRNGIQSNNNLRWLTLDNSPINSSSVFATANLLSLIFPKLDNIMVTPGNGDLWAQVVQLVPNILPNRAGEADYWASMNTPTKSS
ncbi:hypothetical protein C8R44DRAFT_877952 [Mycena epipterygia]|nr:hypothetical protein C8R44DRAFT_877952 [Mycena epipterygia]